MELKEKVMLVGAAKAIGENNSCTSAVARLYKSYKRYWNKRCASLYTELSEQEDMATPSTRAALHVVILAEHNNCLRQTVIRDIIEVFFSKQIAQGYTGDFGIDPEYVGSVLLIYHYYLYITQTQTAEDIKYMELFPKIYAMSSIEHFVDRMLEQKRSNPLYENVHPSERYRSLVQYVYDYAGIKLDISPNTTPKFFYSVAQLLADTRTEEKNYVMLCDIVYSLATLTSKYRESYLKLAIQPEIKRTVGPSRRNPKDLEEIENLQLQISKLQEKLVNSEESHRKELNSLDKAHRAEISKLNKTIKLLQDGKKIKH